MRSLVWFRGKDLRVADHAPLVSAVKGGEVVCAFVLDPYFFAPSRAREFPHRAQFLLESIDALAKNLEALGSRLLLVEGKSVDVIPRMVRAWRIDRVLGHRWCEPFARERDARITKALAPIPFELFEGETLTPPGSIRTGSGGAYSVFTPFARAFEKTAVVEPPLRAPKSVPPPPKDVISSIKQADFTLAEIPSLASLGIKKNPDILTGGERAARARMKSFFENSGARYHEERDRPDLASTSRLSQDLKFGTLSARAVHAAAVSSLRGEARRIFTNEILWREFSHHTLFDRPKLLEGEPFRADFRGFPWRKDARALDAWKTGRTGYPIVDAGARQLLTEGFVHNRVRMIAASFLTKHLMIDWREGYAHYVKWLTDGDYAQNVANWQWVAGCGCDAQPYFRVFNPMTQGERFDPEGEYVKRWVPELRAVDAKYIHFPSEIPRNLMPHEAQAYPKPIVDHAEARGRYLAIASDHLKKRG